MHRFLEFLRTRLWYRPIVTSPVVRKVLSWFPSVVARRLLKRLGPVAVRVRVGNVRFWLVTSSDDDHYLQAMLYGLRRWEAQSLLVWKELCARGGTVVDVGAYGGVYTALAVASGADRVVAYEPNPEMFSRLVDTVSRNGFEDRVILRNVALGGESSSQVLMILGGRPSSSGAHLASAVSDPNYRWETGPVVAVVTLDDDLDELGEAGVSAIKIDAEGFEHEVLSGGLHALREWRPGLIVEFHSLSALAEVQVPLRRFGYGRASFIDVDAQDDRGLDDDFLPGNYLLE